MKKNQVNAAIIFLILFTFVNELNVTCFFSVFFFHNRVLEEIIQHRTVLNWWSDGSIGFCVKGKTHLSNGKNNYK